SRVTEIRPISCTLSAADLSDREGAWKKLMSSGLVKRDAVAGGIRLRAAPGAAAALIDLVNLERKCCPWMQFELSEEAVVTVTAEGSRGAILATMFVSPTEP